MVILILKEQIGSTGEVSFVPVDDYTKLYLKREIGVSSFTTDELNLLQVLIATPGFDKFEIEVQERNIIDELKDLEKGDYL